MLTKITLHSCLALLLIGVFAPPAVARDKDPGKAAYREKFFDDERAVRRTRETNDDGQFAQRLYREAASGQHDEDLTLYLYDKIYEYGLRDISGHQAADDALDKLLEKDPASLLDIGEMRLTLWEKWHESQPDANVLDPDDFVDLCMSLSQVALEAEEINRALKFLNRGNRFATRNDSARKNDVRDSIAELMRTNKINEAIAELEAQRETDPSAADKLAMIYLAELDDPATAAGYAEHVQDAKLSANLVLTATGFKAATPEAASRAGTFYYWIATDAKTQDAVAMYIRARVWLSEYLSRERSEVEADEQADTIQSAKAMVAQIDEALIKQGIGKKLRRKMSSLVRGEGQLDRPAEVQAAIDKGVQWLYGQRKDKTHWEADQPNHRNWGGYTALVVYALLMADEDPRVNSDLSRATHFMMNADMKGTYALCFRVHAWEVLPHRERYRQTLVRDIQSLRGGATKHGFWGYTMTGKDVQPGTRLDTSTTLAGGLGLWIGEEAGRVSTNKVHWERIARAMIKYQLEDGGWTYNPATMQISHGAMTAGAIALLHASYPHLDEATKEKADEAIEKGMAWMDKNFSATQNVNRGGGSTCYYFAAVQHAGLFSGQKQFREMDWYESISNHLVKSQSPTGSWGSVHETAFAIAFLCRGGVEYELSESENVDLQAEPESESEAPADTEDQPLPLAEPSEE